MEEKYFPGSSYQTLFDYLHEEHGLTLLESEMNDLINMVHKFHPASGEGLATSDYEDLLADHRRLVRELDVIMNGDNAAPQASLIDIVCQMRNEWSKRNGARWVKANDRLPDSWHLKCARFIHTKIFLLDPGAWVIDNSEHVGDVEWLDESGVPAAPKPYDELYRLTYSTLAKLRARTREDRILNYGPSIRNLIEEVIKQILDMPQPERINDSGQVYQSGTSAAGRQDDDKAQFDALQN